MSLEVCRLISHQRVTCGVRFVEGIRSEFSPVGPDLFQFFHIGISVLLCTLQKFLMQRFHLVFQLLTHRLTQFVGLTTGKARQVAAQKHDLFLVNGDAIGIIQPFFHHREGIFYRFLAMFAADKLRYIIHWSGTIERIHGYQILKFGRFQFLQIFLHSSRFKLEHAHRIAFGE